MWRDISNKVHINNGQILDCIIHIGVIKDGMIGVLKEGYRVRMEREYDDDGYVNRFFIEKNTITESVEGLLKIACEPVNIVPFLEVRNMKVLELSIKNKPIYFNVDLIESYEKKNGNISILKMSSGAIYEVDYNVDRIKLKIREATSKSEG